MIDFRLRRLGFIILVAINLYLVSPYNPTSRISDISISDDLMAKLHKA